MNNKIIYLTKGGAKKVNWNAIQETLYLNSIPGMTESIIEAGKEPLEECLVYVPDEEW